MEKKLLFIVNPRAGKTKSRAPLFDAVSIYSEAGYLVCVKQTKRRGDATRFAAELGAEFDLVVCHGGDGTLNETVNGLMRLPKERRPLVSYLPGGSTNDFAASLNISSDLAVAAQRAMRMEKRDLDVGVFGSRNFVYVASFGAFTRTTYTVPQDIKNMFGHFAYMLEGVKDLETLRPYRMTITADGEPIRGEYLFGAVSNSTSIAGLMKISPEKVRPGISTNGFPSPFSQKCSSTPGETVTYLLSKRSFAIMNPPILTYWICGNICMIPRLSAYDKRILHGSANSDDADSEI